jgi:hypothetical protein
MLQKSKKLEENAVIPFRTSVGLLIPNFIKLEYRQHKKKKECVPQAY